MPKNLLGISLLAAAAVGPYVAYESGAASGLLSTFTSSSGDPATADGAGAVESAVPGGWYTSTGQPTSVPSMDAAEVAQQLSHLEYKTPELPVIKNALDHFPPIRALSEVLRFDITPEWVPTRFPQVARFSSDGQLEGLRVPLVTGTHPTDLAGTLTYYFDQYKRVQRINVHAVTGDPSRFLAELQHAYQLQQQPTLGGSLYVRKWNGRPTSLVHTVAANSISASEPFGRYSFFLELNQGGLEFGLSPEASSVLASTSANSRW